MEWWNTLHQPASVGKVGTPSIHASILVPLLIMAAAFKAYFFTVALVRMRYTILEREKHTVWVTETVERGA